MKTSEHAYTLIGIRGDGGRPALEIATANSLTIKDAAARFLREHTTCDAVEAWLEGLVVLSLRRSELAPLPLQQSLLSTVDTESTST